MAIANPIPISIETTVILEKFANYLFARRGLAEGTIDLSVGYIRRLIPVMGTHPSQETLDGLIANMRRRKVSYGSLTNTMRAIERYMTFIGDPIKFGRPRKPIKAELKVLSEGKVTLMLAATRTLRERALLAVLAYTGMRNHELIDLRVRDVDIPQQTITVVAGKAERGRHCCLSGECAEILSDYLRERNGQPEDFLFVTFRHGHQLQTQDVRKFVRVIARRAGVKGRIWPHLLRHSLATALLDRGASIYSIQALLGHAFIATTIDNYLHPGTRNVRADYHRCVPSFL